MKGIILAGGKGSRLFPLTLAVSKQLLPVCDKPMIYYPLSILMLAGIREILIISTKEDLPLFQKLLGDGSFLGIKFSYIEQPRPEGLAQAFILGKSFIGKDPVCLILGDNIFYGHDLPKILQKCSNLEKGALIFGYKVKNPSQYGVLELNERLEPVGIEEKPKKPKSDYAIPGLYFYDNEVIKIAESLKPSKRNELEITDIHLSYLKQKNLHVELLGRGFAWLDTGTHEDFQKASEFIHIIQERQNMKIACVEEIAYHMGYINKKELLAHSYDNNYGHYLRDLCK